MPASFWPRITPYLRYEDATEAVAWLTRAFGFRERSVMRDANGKVAHAELAFGEDGVILLGAVPPPYKNPKHLGQFTQSQYVYVDDVDAHCAQARQCGATIIEEPALTPYGDRRYGAADPEGHVWYFAKTMATPER
jgi:uncharacterized glyoxalase superfamily protein PhnB